MKIYTKNGDKGFTSLFGGKSLSKDELRIECYGTVDELNSFVGNLYDHIVFEEIKNHLFIIQNKLFNIGSLLACDPSQDFGLKGIALSDITLLENAIDEMDKKIPPLKNFILPSGHISVSSAHICRTVCRRSERRIVSLKNIEKVDENILVFINRLSDYFFVLARYLTVLLNVEEVKWDNQI